MARASNREAEKGSIRQGLNVLLYYNSVGMSEQYVQLLGVSKCALLVACLRHSWSSVHLSVD